jgi:predicted nucleotidyltransferase
MPVVQPGSLSTSVKIKFLDPDQILAELTETAKALILKNRNIKGIYLFGSLVRRTIIPGSDADILVVLKQDNRRMIDRIPEFHKPFLTISIPTDIFPYTENEIQRMLSENNPFITSIWKEKIILAEQ